MDAEPSDWAHINIPRCGTQSICLYVGMYVVYAPMKDVTEVSAVAWSSPAVNRKLDWKVSKVSKSNAATQRRYDVSQKQPAYRILSRNTHQVLPPLYSNHQAAPRSDARASQQYLFELYFPVSPLSCCQLFHLNLFVGHYHLVLFLRAGCCLPSSSSSKGLFPFFMSFFAMMSAIRVASSAAI